MDVSVVIVSWNACDYLVNCIKSLKNESGNYAQEIIVVDNDSSDESPETVARKFPEVKLIRNDSNLGFAKANNIGIKASTGRYLFLVNSDVVVLGNCIGKLVEYMDSNENVGMTGPRILNSDKTLQVSCRKFPSVWNNLCQVFGLNKIFTESSFFSEPFMRYWLHDQEREIDVLSGCFWVVRKKALDEVGLLDENFFFYGEDVDWCRRFHDKNWQVRFYPGSEAIHFGGASTDNAPVKYYLEMQKADLQYWKKHHGSFFRTIYLIIIILRHVIRIPIFFLKIILMPGKRKKVSFKLSRAFKCIAFLFGFKVSV